jgi:hypothetical protein
MLASALFPYRGVGAMNAGWHDCKFLESSDNLKPLILSRTEAAQAGISDRTLYRAKEKLHVRSHKIGFDGSWAWELPKVANEGGQ